MGGFFGVASTDDCVPRLFYGTDFHSHLGTRRGGLVVHDGKGFERVIHDITASQFRSKFEPDLHRLKGGSGLGVISDYEDQPLIIHSHLGVYAIVTVGRLHNIDSLARDALKTTGVHFSEMSGNETNQTEVVAILINQEESFAAGIRNVWERMVGSCSILILAPDGLYVARDKFGRTPVILAEDPGGGGRAVTMESCALPNTGFVPIRDLGPGEIVRVTADGIEQLAPPGNDLRICSFLWVYYGFPASSYEGINVETTRYQCGRMLARRDDVAADLVAGVPDSGSAHAIGYAHARGLPYGRPFVKYTPTWPRSFMPQDQRVRDLVAKMKLIPINDLIAGKRLLFCEDSIVRGTQLADTIQRIVAAGAREIHMRPACPPLLYGCPYLNFSRSRSELDLAARRAVAELEGSPDRNLEAYTDPCSERYCAMVERIRTRLGLTSLKYQTLPDLVEAIGLPRQSLCTDCWDGARLPA